MGYTYKNLTAQTQKREQVPKFNKTWKDFMKVLQSTKPFFQ